MATLPIELVKIKAEYITLAKGHFLDKKEEHLDKAFSIITNLKELNRVNPVLKVKIYNLLFSQLQYVQAVCAPEHKEFYRDKMKVIAALLPEAEERAKKYE